MNPREDRGFAPTGYPAGSMGHRGRKRKAELARRCMRREKPAFGNHRRCPDNNQSNAILGKTTRSPHNAVESRLPLASVRAVCAVRNALKCGQFSGVPNFFLGHGKLRILRAGTTIFADSTPRSAGRRPPDWPPAFRPRSGLHRVCGTATGYSPFVLKTEHPRGPCGRAERFAGRRPDGRPTKNGTAQTAL